MSTGVATAASKGTTRGRYAGGDKHGFPRHRQEHEKSCGPACLRMIAEWLADTPQSEYHWRVEAGWTAGEGLPYAKMQSALDNLLGVGAATSLEVDERTEVGTDEVYVLLTDSYGYDGRNVMHWLVLLHTFPSKEEKDGVSEPPQRLALCADPMEDALTVWSWKSLLESRVLRAFKITKTAPPTQANQP